MRLKRFLVFFISLSLIIILLTACGNARRPGDPTTPNRTPDQTPNQLPRQSRVVPRRNVPTPGVPSPSPAPRITPVPNQQGGRIADERRNTNDERNTDTDFTRRAEKISKRVSRLPEIDSATCIITGNTAMIGVQFDEQYKGDITNRIKEKVEKAVKGADRRINRVAVTADPDIIQRMEDIFESVGDGKPISGFAREINELLNRIQPK